MTGKHTAMTFVPLVHTFVVMSSSVLMLRALDNQLDENARPIVWSSEAWKFL